MPDMRPTSYHIYLDLEKMLSGQRPPDFDAPEEGARRDPMHNEELLFIVTHQTMELWFKMIIADLEVCRDLLDRPDQADAAVPEEEIPRICTMLKRIVRVLRLVGDHFSVIETMSPMDFLSFRDKLVAGSGFQSWQFRELEILSGLSDHERIAFEDLNFIDHMDANVRGRVEARQKETSFRDAFYQWLGRTPVDRAFPDFVETFLGCYDRYVDDQLKLQARNPNLPPHQLEAIRAIFQKSIKDARAFFTEGNPDLLSAHAAFVFISTYRSEPLIRWPYAIIERVLEFEEGFRVFRFRHARMVERMIGLRPGTGGSAGVDYLDQTASRYRIFGDLLKATSFLIKEDALPDIPHPEILGFAIDG